MLDKVVRAHLDQMDALEDDIKKDIDDIFKTIDIDALLSDPHLEVMTIVEAVKHLLIERYIKRAIEQGKDFSKKVEKLKRDIVIQDSNDPKLNEAMANDKSRD
jgi:hypothetical protein